MRSACAWHFRCGRSVAADDASPPKSQPGPAGTRAPSSASKACGQQSSMPRVAAEPRHAQEPPRRPVQLSPLHREADGKDGKAPRADRGSSCSASLCSPSLSFALIVLVDRPSRASAQSASRLPASPPAFRHSAPQRSASASSAISTASLAAPSALMRCFSGSSTPSIRGSTEPDALRARARAASDIMLGDVSSWRLAAESRTLAILPVVYKRGTGRSVDPPICTRRCPGYDTQNERRQSWRRRKSHW